MTPFLDALSAAGPTADRASKMALYGQFIGSWDLDVTEYHDDGTTRRRSDEWHFGWALEGRAVQDVWIVPPRGRRGREQQSLRHDALRLRSAHRRLADPVDRAGRPDLSDDGRP